MRVQITLALAMLASAAPSCGAGTPEEDLLDAIRRSDAPAVKALLDRGVPVDSRYRYDRTALSFAADRGNLEIVTLLLDRGARVDAKDSYYKMTPLTSAAMKGHAEIVRLLLARSAPEAAASALLSGIFGGKPAIVAVALAAGKFSPRDLSYALAVAEKGGSAEAAALLRQAGAVPPPKAEFAPTPETLARYSGTYRSADDEAQLAVVAGVLTATLRSTGRPSQLAAIDAQRFEASAPGVTVEFLLEGERVIGLALASIGSVTSFERVAAVKP